MRESGIRDQAVTLYSDFCLICANKNKKKLKNHVTMLQKKIFNNINGLTSIFCNIGNVTAMLQCYKD